MSQYYVSLTRVFPPDDEPKFVGPYNREEEAKKDIEKINKKESLEIVTPDQSPSNVDLAFIANIFTKTEASRNGLRFKDSVRKKKTLIGPKLSFILDYMQLPEKSNDNHNEIMEEDMEDMKIYNQAQDTPDALEIIDEWKSSEALIVTKYPSNVEWLRQNGIFGDVVTRVYPDQIKDRKVVGTLPYRLGVEADEVGVIDLPNIPVSKISKPLNTDDLYEAGANLRWFKVVEMDEFFRKLFYYLKNNQDGRNNILGCINES